jgi:hypothetical protein
MGELVEGKGSTLNQPPVRRIRSDNWVLIPKDYSLGPVFAARKHPASREVVVNERRYQIGGFHPMDPTRKPPALDVRHARALFAMLSFRRRGEDTRTVSFSFNELCRKYAHSNGGRYARAMGKIVADLMDSYIRVSDVVTGETHEYRLIDDIDIEKRPPKRKDAQLAQTPQMEIYFHGCTLSEAFYSILNRVTELQHLILDVFVSIRSPLAQAIYLYIPSRAYYHTESDPFEITLTKLLEQVSVKVPEQKNRRRQLFTQNKNSILKQLDGVETLKGIFRVRLVETADGKDYKLQTWVERHAEKMKLNPQNSKLMTAFIQAGHTEEELQRRLDNMEPLNEYELDVLERAGINVEKDRRFLELSKALVGLLRFDEIAADCKNDALEGRAAIKNPSARFIWRIMEAVGQKVATKPTGILLDDGQKLRALLNR